MLCSFHSIECVKPTRRNRSRKLTWSRLCPPLPTGCAKLCLNFCYWFISYGLDPQISTVVWSLTNPRRINASIVNWTRLECALQLLGYARWSIKSTAGRQWSTTLCSRSARSRRRIRETRSCFIVHIRRPEVLRHDRSDIGHDIWPAST